MARFDPKGDKRIKNLLFEKRALAQGAAEIAIRISQVLIPQESATNKIEVSRRIARQIRNAAKKLGRLEKGIERIDKKLEGYGYFG